MNVGVVSYLHMVCLVLCPSLLQIHPVGYLFQVSKYLSSLSNGVFNKQCLTNTCTCIVII